MSRPMVRVVQEVTAATASPDNPDLNTVIVGLAYDVHRYADEGDALQYTTADFGTDGDNATEALPLPARSDVTITEVNLPAHRTGAILDTASVVVYVEDAWIVMDSGVDDVTLASPPDNVITFGTAVDSAVAVGDRLVIHDTSASVDTVSTIIAISEDYTEITIADDISAAVGGTDTAWRIEHAISGVALSAGVSVDGTTRTTTIDGPTSAVTYLSSSRVLSYGKLFIEYRELRQDLSSDISTFSSSAEMEAELGVTDSDNPLGLAASLYFAQTTAPLRVLGLDSDDTDGHSAAINTLAARTDVYCIVVLSSTSAILASYKNHVEAMSDSTKSKFRIAVGGGSLVTSLTIVPATADGSLTTVNASDEITVADATFITAGVAVGDIVTITGNGGYTDGDFEVAAVLSNTRLQIDTVAGVGAEVDGYVTITRALDKQGQVDELEGVPVSFDSKRMILVWPDSIVVEGETVAGYYLGAALGGMISGMPSHQGFTNVGIAGVTGLTHSNFYFSSDQIDELSDAGWYVFIQESVNGLPFSVHQVTTAQSGLNDEVELSIVKNDDFLSYFFIDIVNGFIGKWNINETTLGVIRAALSSGIDAQVREIFPRIGTRIISGRVESVEQNEDDSTRVDANLVLVRPKPLNLLVLKLSSS